MFALVLGSVAFVALEVIGLPSSGQVLPWILIGLVAAVLIAGFVAGARGPWQWVGISVLTIVCSFTALIWFIFTFVRFGY